MPITFLISGASGFVGSALTRRLVKKNQTVHIILRKKSNTWRLADILDKVTIHYSDLSNTKKLIKIVQKIKPNIIYHLATYGAYPHQKNISKMVKTNILGTSNLLQACNTVKYDLFVNTGSSSEYGFKKRAMKETDILEPNSYYGVTKSAQTLLCCHAASQNQLPIVTLRLFSVYGPYEDSHRFVPTLLNSIYFKKVMNLVTPDIVRDFVYIDDVIDAYLQIKEIKNYSGQYFNIGTGIQSTLKDVVNTAVKISHKTTKFNWGKMKPRSWDTNNWLADISQAKRYLGWTPKTNLEGGLKLTWNWFKKYNRAYKNESKQN